jgi:serine protein kinase
VKIDVPYGTSLSDEIKTYEKSFDAEKVLGKHIAPHIIEVAAMWAVLTRLEQPKHASLTLLETMKLYNGKALPGFTEDNIIELNARVPTRAYTASARATSRRRSPTRWCAPGRGQPQPVHGAA